MIVNLQERSEPKARKLSEAAVNKIRQHWYQAAIAEYKRSLGFEEVIDGSESFFRSGLSERQIHEFDKIWRVAADKLYLNIPLVADKLFCGTDWEKLGVDPDSATSEKIMDSITAHVPKLR